MVRYILALLAVTASLFGQEKQQQQQPAAQRIAIRAGALIDGKSNDVRRNVVINVVGNKIESVTDGASFKPATGTQVIDLSKSTVLPGLIDSHTHLFLMGEEPSEGGYDINILKYSVSYRSARATANAKRALEQGFTTIRDVETEGAGYGDVGIKQAVNEGYIPGPRIFASTRAISTSGGYPLEGYAPEYQWPKGVQIVDGPVEARKAAREQLDNGADWIKVYMTHRSWVDKDGNLQSQPTLTLDEIKAITDEVHGWGKKVACHAYNGVGLQRALDGGCDSIEHGLEITDAQIQQMLKQGTWYCPTMAVYHYYWPAENTDAGKRDRKRASVHDVSFSKAHKAGVKIVYGTDVGGFPWSDPMAQDFAYMVKDGMSPMDAIKAATSNAAEMLGMSGQIGTVAPGAFADIVAVSGDPVANVDVLKNVQFVMKDGKVYKQ
jgi:imidazolonepropionase-like amidohydrolase